MNKQKYYHSFYGNIPDDEIARLEYIAEGQGTKKLLELFENNAARFNKIRTKKVKFIWYTEPHPSARPRANTSAGYVRMYVPHAAETKKDFIEFFREALPDFKIIDTPMKFNIKAYAKTPSNFNRLEKLLAETGYLKPFGRVFDGDNVYKAYTDCTMGTLISDDSLIYEGGFQKFYSIKPRVEFYVEYMTKFPIVEKR